MVLLGKTKLNKTEVLIYMSLADSYISYAKFVSIINVLKEYDEIKEKMRNSNKNLMCLM